MNWRSGTSDTRGTVRYRDGRHRGNDPASGLHPDAGSIVEGVSGSGMKPLCPWSGHHPAGAARHDFRGRKTGKSQRHAKLGVTRRAKRLCRERKGEYGTCKPSKLRQESRYKTEQTTLIFQLLGGDGVRLPSLISLRFIDFLPPTHIRATAIRAEPPAARRSYTQFVSAPRGNASLFVQIHVATHRGTKLN